MNLNSDDILQLAATIWEATLSIPIGPDAGGKAADSPRNISACIQLTGGWNGAIFLDCPNEVASHAASIMFSADPATMTVPDLQDAVAELVNMVGGNLKALIPDKCYLSLPSVVEGGDYSARVPGSREVNRTTFDSQGYTVTISILEKNTEVVAAA